MCEVQIAGGGRAVVGEVLCFFSIVLYVLTIANYRSHSVVSFGSKISLPPIASLGSSLAPSGSTILR